MVYSVAIAGDATGSWSGRQRGHRRKLRGCEGANAGTPALRDGLFPTCFPRERPAHTRSIGRCGSSALPRRDGDRTSGTSSVASADSLTANLATNPFVGQGVGVRYPLPFVSLAG